LAEAHLQEWVQRAGEEEVRSTARKSMGFPPLSFHKRRSLTIDDYLQEEKPIEKIQQQKEQNESS
jgi:hypothetical protein